MYRRGDAGSPGSAHWPEVEAGPRRLLVVPVGSLEQHGAHLPLDTDTRIAAAVADRACAGRPGWGWRRRSRSGRAASTPTSLARCRSAVSPCRLCWWSSAATRPSTGRRCSWSTATAATSPRSATPSGQLHREGRRCHAWHAGLRPGMLATAEEPTPDAHAGRIETSMMLALAPRGRAARRRRGGRHPPAGRDPVRPQRARGRQVSPNGVLGDPAGASAAEGERAALAARRRPQPDRRGLLTSMQ